jgi:hypothetical protein
MGEDLGKVGRKVRGAEEVKRTMPIISYNILSWLGWLSLTARKWLRRCRVKSFGIDVADKARVESSRGGTFGVSEPTEDFPGDRPAQK